MPGSGLTWTWEPYRAIRLATLGGGSGIQSARPASIAAASCAGVSPILHTIRSGYPSGCAAADHWRNFGFLPRSTSLPGTYLVIMYGPVAGTGFASTSRAGTLAGTGAVNEKASLYRKSPSGAARWRVTVRAWSSTVTARDKSQGEPLWHASAPRSLAKNERAAGLSSKTRSSA